MESLLLSIMGHKTFEHTSKKNWMLHVVRKEKTINHTTWDNIDRRMEKRRRPPTTTKRMIYYISSTRYKRTKSGPSKTWGQQYCAGLQTDITLCDH